MKAFYFLLFCLTITFFSSAQEQKFITLKELISNAEDDFINLRPSTEVAVSHPQEVFYKSFVLLEGSKDNIISLFPETSIMYQSWVGDSLSLKQAEKVLKDWKEKIGSVTPGYKEEFEDFKKMGIYINGYSYHFKKVVSKVVYTVSVLLRKSSTDKYYSVIISMAKQWKGAPESK